MDKIASKTSTSNYILENRTGRNFITDLLVNYLLPINDMQECRDESDIYNCKWIQLSNDKFINEILGGKLGVA